MKLRACRTLLTLPLIAALAGCFPPTPVTCPTDSVSEAQNNYAGTIASLQRRHAPWTDYVNPASTLADQCVKRTASKYAAAGVDPGEEAEAAVAACGDQLDALGKIEDAAKVKEPHDPDTLRLTYRRHALVAIMETRTSRCRPAPSSGLAITDCPRLPEIVTDHQTFPSFGGTGVFVLT